jgi:YfiH family protein
MAAAAVEQGFQLRRYGALAYLRAPLLEGCRGVVHAFSTRLGGCSTGTLTSLNTAFHTGDRCGRVLENRRRFLERCSFHPDDVVAAVQVHGAGIRRVEAADRGRGARPDSFLGEGDALVTVVPGLPLTGYAADCLLLFIAAPDVPAVALVHAGWRGTLQQIAPAVVRELHLHFGADPAVMLAALSPGICGRCYTVDRDLGRDFAGAGWSGAPYQWAGAAGRIHLDLAAINREQLRRAGIEAGRLAGCSWCTGCHPRLFYSYRREKGQTGRMMGLIALSGESVAEEADQR